MAEKHEIITPVFKSKPSNLKKHLFMAWPTVKAQLKEPNQL
ncbi:hypothetical protein [Limosilactobacillus caccae]|jgi:hypothetical protein|nr:hypothetical protein [Limosilactobacillus caccae]